MKKVFYLTLVFMSGGVFAVNLAGLIPTNPEYHCSWPAVFLAFGLACLFSSLLLEKK